MVTLLNLFIAYHPSDREVLDEWLPYIRYLDTELPNIDLNIVHYDGSLHNQPAREDFKTYLNRADVLLMLISKAFLTSDYYISDELQAALLRHKTGTLQVIPVIARMCFWEDTRLRQYPPLPLSGMPIMEMPQRKATYQLTTEQLLNRLGRVVNLKKDNAIKFRQFVEEGDRFFAKWQDEPDVLMDAKDYYVKALALHQYGLIPDEHTLQQKIAVCERENDFRYYASAAENAYKAKDYKGVIYHANDALSLRADARMQRLVRLAEEHQVAIRQAQKHVPFHAHIRTADDFYMDLNWLPAEQEYLAALDFWEEGFKPTQTNILKKIELCRRERESEIHLIAAEKALALFDYDDTLKHLEAARSAEQPRITILANRCLYLLEQEQNVSAFQDDKTLLWGYYDRRTDIVTIPPRYEEAYSFSEHLAGVRKASVWGFIDIEGNQVIPFEYEFVSHFKNGRSEVIKNGERFYINRQGERYNMTRELPSH